MNAQPSRNPPAEPLGDIDKRVRDAAWCAESIERETDAPIYRFYPPDSTDTAFAARLGISTANHLHRPITVWKNDSELT